MLFQYSFQKYSVSSEENILKPDLYTLYEITYDKYRRFLLLNIFGKLDWFQFIDESSCRFVSALHPVLQLDFQSYCSILGSYCGLFALLEKFFGMFFLMGYAQFLWQLRCLHLYKLLFINILNTLFRY